MQAKNLEMMLVALALLLAIPVIDAPAKEIILFSEQENWGWIKDAELSNENPYEGDFSLKAQVDDAGWLNHGPHDIPNGNLFEFEDDAGDLPLGKVVIEFYYDVGKADIGYWEVTFHSSYAAFIDSIISGI